MSATQQQIQAGFQAARAAIDATGWGWLVSDKTITPEANAGANAVAALPSTAYPKGSAAQAKAALAVMQAALNASGWGSQVPPATLATEAQQFANVVVAAGPKPPAPIPAPASKPK